MAFATIGGVVYQVLTAGTTENARERIGQVRRTFSGTARSSVRAEKQSYAMALAPITPAAYATLIAATTLGAAVACSGDFNGGVALSYIITISQAGYFKPNQIDGMYRLVVLDLMQV